MSDAERVAPSSPRFKAAFDAYVQHHWGGWTEYAKVHTQTSGALDKAAFFEGYAAALAALTLPDLCALVAERSGGAWVAVPRDGDEDTRWEIARILETVAKDGLPGPRDLDVALDAIFCTIAEDAAPAPGGEAGR